MTDFNGSSFYASSNANSGLNTNSGFIFASDISNELFNTTSYPRRSSLFTIFSTAFVKTLKSISWFKIKMTIMYVKNQGCIGR